MVGPPEHPANPTSRLSSEGLTYGVELEFVLAFHQNELEVELAKNKDGVEYSIAKNLSYFDREARPFTPMSLVEFPNRVYHSWGIRNRDPLSHKEMILPYGEEPMNILGRKLHERYPNFIFKIETVPWDDDKIQDRYAQWLIATDHSICGVGSENIPARLGRNDIEHAENWDSYGIELVSRVLNSNSLTAKDEIAKVVEAVKEAGNKSHGVFITNQ